MQTSTSITGYDHWTHPAYEVRVRGTTTSPMYLWGSAGISENITFDKPIILHIRNDLHGEVITFGTQTTSGAQKTQQTIGTLQPGECMSIALQGISGVFATCELESTVCCLIR
jgi:hypothetical protein